MRVVGFRDLDLVDYIVIQEGRAVGCIYEDRQTLPDLRWFCSITIYVNPKRDILTHPKRRACHDSVRHRAHLASLAQCSHPRRMAFVSGVNGQSGIRHRPELLRHHLQLLGSFLRSRERLRQPHAVDPGTLPEVGIGTGVRHGSICRGPLAYVTLRGSGHRRKVGYDSQSDGLANRVKDGGYVGA